ncbi:MAG: hypothetical protein ACO3UU_06510 [Minisyncoccia bacterium]
MKILILMIVIGLLTSCASANPQLTQNGIHDPLGWQAGAILRNQSQINTNYTIEILNMKGIPEAKQITKDNNGHLIIK